MPDLPTDRGDAAEFRLVVWTGAGRSWRARVVGADRREHDFTDPFELARFLAWPLHDKARPAGHGLR